MKCSYISGAGYKMMQPLWKKVLQFSEELNRELAHGPAILRLGVKPREPKTDVHTINLYVPVHGSTIHNSPKLETTQMPTN